MQKVSVEKVTVENVEECFTFKPWDEEQVANGKLVVAALIAATKVIIENVPDCPDRTVAIRKLREARMDANSAITHRGRF